MLGVYAQELQALKAELHHTLARLGDGSSSASSSAPAPVASSGQLPFFVTPGVRRAPSSQQHQQGSQERWSARPASANSWSVASTRTITTATNTPEVPDAAGDQQQQRTVAGTTTWDARQLMHELRTASQRRRELEIELASEMRREQERQRHTDARIPWQNAIAALQRQRAAIVREIELESQRDLLFTGVDDMETDRSVSSDGGDTRAQQLSRVLYRDSGTQMSPLPPTPPPVRNAGRLAASVSTGYAIEGVVTLEPLQQTSAQPTQRTTTATSHSQQPRHTATTSTSASTGTSLHHQQHPPNQQQLFKHELFGRPESHHDALNEVFSIQLKFAETMLKLEKSVQIRDQLLQRNAGHRSRRGLTRMPTRRVNSTTAVTASHDHHHDHHRSGHSDSESYYEDDMVSSDYDSFSSGASLGDYAMRLRRYTSDHDSAIYAATSTNRDTYCATAPAPSAEDGPQANNFNLSAVEEEERGDEEATGAGDASSSASPDSQEARTPSTENSDKSSNTSSTTKQVRFGDCGGNEYSTPVIARKFNFDNQSDDENEDDDRESILSFMDGSSVTSTELNDRSLIKAFNAFRRELGNLKAATPQWQNKSSLPSSSGITAAISAARALFASDESDAEEGKRAMLKPAVSPAEQDPIVVANAGVAIPRQPQKQEKVPHSKLVRAALSERRRQLCLDIQAESAQLVLTFGSRNAHETERVKQHLIELRAQLRTVDEQFQQCK